MVAGTNNLSVRRRNRQAVLDILYRNQEMTRKDIADHLGLSFPTVTQILSELEEEGLVRTSGQQASTGGRRAFLNAIVADARMAVGLSVSRHWVDLVLMNLSPEAVATEEHRILFEDTPDYWEKLRGLVDDLLARNGVEAERMLGLGISFPGVVSTIGNALEFAPTLGLERLELGRIAGYFPYRTFFGNDAKLASRAEAWFRPELGKAVYLLLSRGVGGAVISEKEEIFGSRACEFGHMVVREDGKPCSCGRRGCLEAYCSTAVLAETLGPTRTPALEDFFTRLEQGEERQTKVWEEYLGHLATGIGNLRAIFDADVIIGGEMARYLRARAAELKEALGRASGGRENGSYLRFCNYGQYDAAIGAALYHIDRFLSES